jgi:iron complex transport system substrate-binding protein
VFLFEKKNEHPPKPPASPAAIIKSFLLLFFKKEALAFLFVVFPSACPAAKVVSLNLCTDQLLVLLAADQVAALEPLARDPALSFVAAQAAHLPQVQNDAEAVLALHPDLVLAGDFSAQTTLALLRQRGVRVVQLADADSFPAIAAQVTQLAGLLGVAARGQALVARMWRSLAAVRKKSGTALLWQAHGWSAGPGSLGDTVLRAAGYTDIGTGGRVGLESLVAHPPGLLVTETAPRFPSMSTDLAWHPALRGIPRRFLPPPLLICGGPFTARAVALLTQ